MKMSGTHLIMILCSILVLGGCKESSMKATKWLVAGPDKELVEALKQQVKRDSINRTPEQIEALEKQQEENERIAEMREDAIRQMREDGIETAKYYDDESEPKKEGKLSYNQGLFILVLIIGGFLFMIWWFLIRKIRNKFRDISYMQGEVENKLDHAFKDTRFNNLSEKERESVEKMKAFLNRKNK